MSKSQTSKVLGLADLQEKLIALGDLGAGNKALRKATRLAMKPTIERIRAAAPFDEGDLRDSIHLGMKAPKSGPVVSAGMKIGERRLQDEVAILDDAGLNTGKTMGVQRKINAYYWHMIEFGTSQMAARPYIRPVFASETGAIVERFRNELAKEVERIAKKKR